ncbi:right-handed parallel beta-helix repeat-containing protein [Chloroflexi bacterium TSY]|nr:right-handed parallel beta-helix repeat-containing protein [Chloroflexi bacterium TSY]
MSQFVVDTTTDTVDTALGDGACADTGGQCSLRAAIQEANALAGDDVIILSSSAYTLTIGGKKEDASATGDLDINSPDAITIVGDELTKISATGISDRVFHLLQGAVTMSTVTIVDGNVAGHGGGILVESAASLSLDRSSIFWNNANGHGGGIYASGPLVIDRSSIKSNNVFSGSGGGIYIQGSTLDLRYSRINSNYAQGSSAPAGSCSAIYNNGTVTVLGSEFDFNRADLEGGAIYNAASRTITLTNNVLTENGVTISDLGKGSGIYNAGIAILLHNSLNENVDPFGALAASLYNASTGTMDVTHTIVDNSPFMACTNSGTFNDNGYNLFEDFSCLSDPTSSSGNPGFDATGLADNGGPTLSLALTAASIAKDAGDPAIPSPPANDQRGPGFPRIVGGRIDIGAFEYDVVQSGFAFEVNTLDDDAPLDPLDGLSDPADSVAIACSVSHCSLREAIMAANSLGGGIINFDIAGSGQHIIQPNSVLPTLTDSIFMDGNSEPDGNIVLDGGLAGTGVDGLTLSASSIDITGLEITNFDGDGLVVISGTRSTFSRNSIHTNGGLGIDLNNDGVTANDFLDADAGPNDLQNAPVLQRVIISGTETIIQGFLASEANGTYGISFYSNDQCDSSFYGEGKLKIGSTTVDTDANGFSFFQTTLSTALNPGTGVTAMVAFGMDLLVGSSEFSRCLIAGPNNDSWPNAFEIPLLPVGTSGDTKEGSTSDYISIPGQSRWFRFPVAPNSKVIVDLTNLPANYDIVLFRDIAKTYNALTAPQDLVELTELNAEFAPEQFTPEQFTPDMLTPDQRYFSLAQAQSAVAVSAFDGTADETVVANSWSETQ